MSINMLRTKLRYYAVNTILRKRRVFYLLQMFERRMRTLIIYARAFLPHMIFTILGSTLLVIEIGSNIFTNTAIYRDGSGNICSWTIALSIDGIPIIGFTRENDHLFLNATLFDECNNCILEIRENQLVYVPDTWDIGFTGKRLVLKEAARRVMVDMLFSVPNKIIIQRGRILCNGVELLIRPESVHEPRMGATLSWSVASGELGLAVGARRLGFPAAAFGFGNPSRYLSSRLC